MIENTNLKNDMAHAFSRRNMIMPPASVEQAMDAEGIEAGTVVTIDGVKYEGGPLNLVSENKNVQIPAAFNTANRNHYCEDGSNIYYVSYNSNNFGYIDENNNVHSFTSSMPRLNSIIVFGNDVYVFGNTSVYGSTINKYEIYHKNDLSTLVNSYTVNLGSYYVKGFEYNNIKYLMAAGSSSGFDTLYSLDGSTTSSVSITWDESVSKNKYFVDFKIVNGKLYGCYNTCMNVVDLATMTASQYSASVVDSAFSGDAALFVDGSNIKILSARDNISNYAQVFDTVNNTFLSSEPLPPELIGHCWMGVLYTNIGKYLPLADFKTVSNSAAVSDHATVNFKDGALSVLIVIDSNNKFANVTQSSFKEV